MKLRYSFAAALVIVALSLASLAAKAGDNKAGENKDAPSATSAASHAAQDDPLRFEGEKRYHANCGRCHAAPPKFSPRMMATIIRHMRVRATITNEDMRLILHYMSE